VRPGAHINAAGANMLFRRELPDALVGRADRVVVDNRDQARYEALDLILPVERGLLYWERVVELREIVGGQAPGRAGEQEITLFKSLGLGLEDVAAGALAYRRAVERGVGEQIALLD
jgi:ornithine cyclodeaminase/alanine dehydrogenase-like protein (mu-crystallin family)